MLRFIARVIATLLFTAAVLSGLLDASRTVALDRVVATPLGEELAVFAPEAIAAARAFAGAYPFLPTVLEAALQLPAWSLFGALALIFALLSQRPEPRWRRYVHD